MKIIILTALIMLLTACASQSISDYRNNTPQLNAEKFFNGKLVAHGVVKNRSGKVIRYFNADIDASWEGGTGILKEKFLFNDGEIQYRTWHLTPESSENGVTRFKAQAEDVVGIGAGYSSGNAINLNYVLAVKYNQSVINLRVDDWMWLTDANTIINESTLSKFGFKVGSVQLTIRKL